MSTQPPLIIDMHTHFFNAKYVPLKEIAISRGIPKRLASPLARILLILTRSSKLRIKTQEKLNVEPESIFLKNQGQHTLDYRDDISGLLISDILSQLFIDVASADNEFEAQALMYESSMLSELRELNLEFGDDDSAAELSNLINNTGILRNSESFKGLYTHEGFILSPLKRMLRRLLKAALKYVESAGDVLDFFYSMTTTEKQLLNRLSSYYKKKETPYLFIHYMMDMEHPFDGDVVHDFYPTQIQRMAGLEQYSKGTLVGFSAFDPIRFLGGRSEEEIREEIHQHMNLALDNGKLGFKFYPPLGFRAAGNDDERIEVVVDIFLDRCAEQQIPVFTHCTPSGFEIVPKQSGSYSHPDFWRKALEKNGRSNLRLCFGHAGGGIRNVQKEGKSKTVMGWLSNDEQWKDEDNYARIVVEICKEFKNVYCEIAYTHSILDSPELKAAFKARLITEFEQANDGNYDFSKKIMYGSDWHMPSMINEVDDYLDILLGYFDTGILATYRNLFFAGNAIVYLQISAFVERIEEQLGASYHNGLVSILNEYPAD